MKLRAFDIDKDFDVIRNWITDARTYAMWSANRIGFPMERKEFEDFLKRQREEGDSAFAAENEDERIVGFFLYGKNEETMEGMLKFIVVRQARSSGNNSNCSKPKHFILLGAKEISLTG